jgi:hypothetical protein
MEINKIRAFLMFTALALTVFLAGPGTVFASCVGSTQSFEFGDTVTESCTFDSNMVRPAGVTGHGLIIGAAGITIDGNGFCLDGVTPACIGGEDNDAGIYVEKHFGQEIDNVTVKNLEVKNFCHGIQLIKKGPATVPDMTGCLIECCEVHDNGDCNINGSQTQGIKWNNVSESEIRDCKVYNQCGDPDASGPPGAFGIYLCRGDDNEWHHNEVYNTHKAGLFLRCSPWRAWLHHNYLHNNPFAGIRCQCINDRDFTVEYNYCYNNRGTGSGSWSGGYGIFFGGANTDPNCCRYNVCKENFVGISFEREAWCGYLYENTACQNIDNDGVPNDINVQNDANVTGDCNTCDFATGYDDTSAASGGCLYACGEQPTAVFSYEATGLSVVFTDTSVPGNDPIDSYYWDFGDCSVPGTSTDQNPTHLYTEAGTYTVCLSVTDIKACPTGCPCDTPPGAPGQTEGRRDTVCQHVVVSEGPDSDGDGVPDLSDNCRLTPNPFQEDTDSDNYGNWCDCDLDNDWVVGASDYGSFCSAWGSADPDADFDCNGIVGAPDYGIFCARWLDETPFE